MSTVFKTKGKRKAKVFIGVGHGGSDPGAVKYVKEAETVLDMALACKNYLVARGVEVCLSRVKNENDPVNEEVRECNAYKPALAIDCHANAGGGDGFEAFYYSGGGKSKTLASNINAEVKKIGQNSRGIKTKTTGSADYYAFIRDTYAPAVICECAFVDNKTDVKIIDTLAERKKFGEAYAKGILKTLGISSKPTTVSPNKKVEKKSITEVAEEVIAGKWGNGAVRIARLTTAGYNYKEVQKRVNELLR